MRSSADAVSTGLPRELAPGIVWIGECFVYSLPMTKIHAGSAAYLVSGREASLLVETGFPEHFEIYVGQIDSVIASGAAPLRYLFCSHWEPPHVGGAGLLLERYQDLVYCGDPTDFHLMFPAVPEDRMLDLPVGSSLDLGGREFMAVPGVFIDGRSTRWGFDPQTRTLFSADGLSYGHMHSAGQCNQTIEEVGALLDVPAMTAMFADAAFYWTRFVDVEPFITRLAEVLEKLDVQLICPAHGLPMTDPAKSMTLIDHGTRMGASGDLPVGR